MPLTGPCRRDEVGHIGDLVDMAPIRIAAAVALVAPLALGATAAELPEAYECKATRAAGRPGNFASRSIALPRRQDGRQALRRSDVFVCGGPINRDAGDGSAQGVGLLLDAAERWPHH